MSEVDWPEERSPASDAGEGPSTGRLRQRWLEPLALGLLALAPRLYALDSQSYWYDEDLSLEMGRLGFFEIVRVQAENLGNNTYPPLHSLVFHLWSLVAGDSACSGRLFSALCGSALVLFTFALVRRSFGRRAAWIAGLLLVFSQFAVQYSQEMRAYALLQLLVVSALAVCDRALRSGRLAEWLGLAALSTAIVYTHYYGLFAVAGILLHALVWRAHRPPLAHWLLGGALALVLFAPWIAASLDLIGIGGEWQSTVRPHWFSVGPDTLLDVLARYNGAYWKGVVRDPYNRAAQLGLLLLTLPSSLLVGWLATSLGARRSEASANDREIRRAELRSASLFAIPCATATLGPILLGFAGLPFADRYTTPALAPYLAIAGIALARIRPRLLGNGWVAAAIGLNAVGLHASYTIDSKEDWRTPLARLAREYRPGDCTVFTPFGGPPLAWQTYHRGEPRLRTISLAEAGAIGDECERIWLMSYARLREFAVVAKEARDELATSRVLLDESRHHWTRLALFGGPQPR